MAAPAAYRTETSPAPETGANAPMTADEFLRLKEEGFFGKHRVELRRGVVTLKLPSSNLHTKALALVLEALGIYRDEAHFLACQSTVKVGEHDAPEPDAFLVRGDVHDIEEEITPERIELAVEVSVSTLRSDRGEKAAIYAEAGIPEYWIVNPVGRQVEVRRDPDDGEYRTIYVLNDSHELAPLFAPDRAISTGALMPRMKTP